MADPKTKSALEEELKKARNELAEKVSIAGLKEALQEYVLWIRKIFQLVLFSFVCCSIYYTYQIVTNYFRSGYTNEISHKTGLEILPMSNVTVCAQVYFNETFVKNNVTVSTKIIEMYQRELGKTVEELYSDLTLFLSLIVRPRSFSPLQLTLFNKILKNNQQIYDYSAFAAAALPTCQKVLKRCWFDGKEFDCCQKAVQSIDEDGICYLIALNFDSDNAFPMPSTIKQRRPGPSGGLTIETSLELKDFPWLEDDADNGFKVFVNAVPYSPTQSPLTSPSGAETFVRVKAAKRLLSTNCVPYNRLVLKKDTPITMFYYDPEGIGCAFDKFVSMNYKFSSCYTALYTYRPNASIVCGPLSQYFATLMFFSDLKNDIYAKLHGNDKTELLPIASVIRQVDEAWKMSATGKAQCQKHCQYWEYSSTSSFIYLEKDDRDPLKTDRVMFSKIHVYYGDLEYRQYEETKKQTSYVAFCNFANVVMLYLGMSIISFFSVSFYLSRYLYAYRRLRGASENVQAICKCRRIGNVKVHPK